jgi:DNA (cytosine-5)-methyltransferase 1
LATSSSVYKNAARKEYILTEEKRDEYRRISQESRLAKLAAENGLHKELHAVNRPNLDPNILMPQLTCNDLSCLSLFSGGGGMDLGFDRGGFAHIASYELIPICEETLLRNRPDWTVFSGPEDGDVTKVDWSPYKGKIDVIHGGPPCQPFSIAGEQKGVDDERNMWGEFSRAVNCIQPKAFVAENVLGLLNPKFDGFIKTHILDQLNEYSIVKFEMHAADFGVPQVRRRVFFVGFRNKKALSKFSVPEPTHLWRHLGYDAFTQSLSIFDGLKPKTMGVREALGLTDIDFDNLAPTIRSGFTGKRNTTSVLNSSAGQKTWGDMEIWPNGIQTSRKTASQFPAKFEHFRLSVQDIALIQGFPETWQFAGAVYQILGQIGNSVVPPVAYQVAKNVAFALSNQ